MMRFSLIIPVFNRPQEMQELLESCVAQTDQDFEVVIVEDGSEEKSELVIRQFNNHLNINYFYKENSGPGLSRNYGFKRAKGNYAVFLDSDCVLPPTYIESLRKNLNADAFGGPDAAHSSFTDLQKAINYSMTSFFTTGGIRGGTEKMGKFHPRSFNMGYSKDVFEKTGGFSSLRFGEDIDMSLRIIKGGFTTQLIKEAFVYHKRRSTLKQFFKQVYNSGIARINLYKRHPSSLKLVHFLPAVFTLGVLTFLIAGISVSPIFIFLLYIHAQVLFLDSLFKTRSLKIAFLSVITSYIQLIGYGLGFIKAVWRRLILKQGEFKAFEKTFYE